MPSSNQASRLLLMADDPLWRDEIYRSLSEEGYEVVQQPFPKNLTTSVSMSVAGCHADLLVFNLPSQHHDLGTSLDWLQGLRRRDSATPMILLAHQATESDRVALLNAGADDVLVQPIGLRECVARCRALLRRIASSERKALRNSSSEVLRVGPICLDPQQCRVTLDGQEVSLSPREFRLLECLMRHPGRAFTRDQLIEQVWGPDFVGNSKSVDVHMLWLRRKLDVASPKPELFITVRGVGYRMDPPRP